MIPRRELQVVRPHAGQYVEGRYAPGVAAVTTIRASVQPLTGKQLEALPEGRRSKQSFTLFSDQALRPWDGENPDRVVIDGGAFEVFSVSPWQNGIIPHYEMVVQRIGPSEPSPVGA